MWRSWTLMAYSVVVGFSEADRELTFPSDEDERAEHERGQAPAEPLEQPGGGGRDVVDQRVAPGAEHRRERVQRDDVRLQVVPGQLGLQLPQHRGEEQPDPGDVGQEVGEVAEVDL